MPGPVAAMIGEGHLAGLMVVGDLLVGVAIQPMSSAQDQAIDVPQFQYIPSVHKEKPERR